MNQKWKKQRKKLKNNSKFIKLKKWNLNNSKDNWKLIANLKKRIMKNKKLIPKKMPKNWPKFRNVNAKNKS